MAFPVSVPAHQRAAIEELASLAEEAYQAIRDCLTRTGPLAEPSALIEQTSKAVANNTKLGGQVLGMVIGLRSLVDRSCPEPESMPERPLASARRVPRGP